MLSSEELNSSLALFQGNDEIELLKYQLTCELRKKIGPTFWRLLSKCSSYDGGLQPMDCFVKAVSYLHTEISKYWSMTDAVFRSESIALVKSVLFCTLSLELKNVMRFIYQKTFFSFYRLQNRGFAPLSSPSDGVCDICSKAKTKCQCWMLVEKFRQSNQQLLELNLLDRLAGETVVEIAHSTIQERVHQTCGSIFDVERLPELKEWLNTSVLPWLAEVYGQPGIGEGNRGSESGTSPASTPDAEDIDRCRRQFEHQKRRLTQFLHESCASHLIERLFDIIIDYPESTQALSDLKHCLQWVSARSQLTTTLRRALERRLLHPGVNTSDILTAYMQTVSSLRLLDASGVLTENVCHPVRNYLRNRSDTVRCIVSYLTDNRGLDANAGLVAGNTSTGGDLSFSGSVVGNENELEDPTSVDANWIDWQPDPMDVAPDSFRHTRKSADVISMVVGVYGSREQFVKEYCQLLAERLLRAMSYNVDDEVRYLELLKLRFGESELNQCEVMLKDIKDSQRIETFVNSQPPMKESGLAVRAMVLSSYFWPSLKDETMELPKRIQTALDTYSKCYESLKASRTLQWKPYLGLVELALEMGGRVLTWHVNPVLASIIMHFEEKDQWTAQELASSLKVPQSFLKRRIGWWAGIGVLKETSTGVYQLCSELPPLKQRGVTFGLEDDDETDDAATESDKVEQLETYWAYITSLLKNFDSLTPDRIHSLLRMFCMDSHGPSLETVHSFLQKKVRDQLLTYAGGSYKLPKK